MFSRQICLGLHPSVGLLCYYVSLIKTKCKGTMGNILVLALLLISNSDLHSLKYHTNRGNTIQVIKNVRKIYEFSQEKND